MVTVHIIDDDGDLPSLSIEDAEVDEGGQAEFVVRLSKASDGQVEVDYQTKDGTATEGTDYTGESGTLIFEAGDIQKTIEVQTSQDGLDEANEEFAVELSSPNGAALSKGTGTGTITDDDTGNGGNGNGNGNGNGDGRTVTATATATATATETVTVTAMALA